MPVRIRCSGCQKAMKAPDKLRGKTVKCPACSTPIRVPAGKPTAKQKKKRSSPEDGFLSGLDVSQIEDQSEQLCPNCGASMDQRADSCPSCGFDLSVGSASPGVRKRKRKKRSGQKKRPQRTAELGANLSTTIATIFGAIFTFNRNVNLAGHEHQPSKGSGRRLPLAWVMITVALVIATFGWAIAAAGYAEAEQGWRAKLYITETREGVRRHHMLVDFSFNAIRQTANMGAVIRFTFQKRLWLIILFAILEVLVVLGWFKMKSIEKELRTEGYLDLESSPENSDWT